MPVDLSKPGKSHRLTKGCAVCDEPKTHEVQLIVHQRDEDTKSGRKHVASRSRSFCLEHGQDTYNELEDLLDHPHGHQHSA